MNLPDFLEDADGFVRLKGHRVGIVHVLREYNAGQSAEMIQLCFPTVSLAHVHKTIAFYLENQDEVDHYIDDHDKEVERQVAASTPPPSIAQLRERLKKMRIAELQPAPTRRGS